MTSLILCATECMTATLSLHSKEATLITIRACQPCQSSQPVFSIGLSKSSGLQRIWILQFLFKLLYTADNEKRLAIKVKKLNEDLLGAQSRVTAALRLSEEDQITIATLRKELERNWKQIDASHDKVCWLSSFSITLDMSMKRVKNCHWDVSMQHLHPALVNFPGINLSTIRCVWTAFAYIQILALQCLRGLGTLGSNCVGLV